MNLRILSVALIVLLVGAIGFGIWQYDEKQRLQTEHDELRSQLDETAAKLREAEDEKRQLEARLNETETKLATLQTQVQQLENKTATLEQEIQKLREQLRRRDYITIGLTFLWNARYNINLTRITETVEYMNRAWDPIHLYYFVYHAQPESFIPLAEECKTGYGIWIDRARGLYDARDVPVALVGFLDDSAGCFFRNGIGVNGIGVNVHSYIVGRPRLFMSVPNDARILLHECLHLLGILDKEIKARLGSDVIIPLEWMSRLEAAAKRFQMTPPPSS